MSILKLFGGGSQKKPMPNPQQTIENLRTTLEMLEKRENYLESKIQKELQTAKAYAGKNQRLAMMALKRKKAYQAQINNLSQARLTLDTQITAIEGATTNTHALNSMIEGARTLRALNRNMEVEDVEEVMEDIREQMEVASEIGAAIANPLGMDELDEAELEDELNALVEEEVNEQFKGVAVPTTKLPTAQQKLPHTEEDEFEALGAEMGI